MPISRSKLILTRRAHGPKPPPILPPWSYPMAPSVCTSPTVTAITRAAWRPTASEWHSPIRAGKVGRWLWCWWFYFDSFSNLCWQFNSIYLPPCRTIISSIFAPSDFPCTFESTVPCLDACVRRPVPPSTTPPYQPRVRGRARLHRPPG